MPKFFPYLVPETSFYMWNKEEILIYNKHCDVSLFLKCCFSRKVARETRYSHTLESGKTSPKPVVLTHPLEAFRQKSLSLSSSFLAPHHSPLKTIGRKAPGTKMYFWH